MGQISSFEKLLKTFRSVYIDTNILIYHLEDDKPYSDLTQLLFEFIQKGQVKGHTSALSLLELNVKPYQSNQPEQAFQHVALLEAFPHFHIHPLSIQMADTAAQIRANYSLKTPDAIHLACALETSCDAFIGNDKELKKTKDLPYIYLNDFIEK